MNTHIALAATAHRIDTTVTIADPDDRVLRAIPAVLDHLASGKRFAYVTDTGIATGRKLSTRDQAVIDLTDLIGCDVATVYSAIASAIATL